MFAIRATVKPDDSGNQVANLQAALLFLLDRDVTLFFDPLKTPPPDELKGIREALLVESSTMLFDQTTRVLTVAFQQRGDLFSQDQGVVDQTTADALNDRLRQLGGLDDDKTLAVKGRVRRAGIDEPQPGVQVRVVAVDANGETALGETETDNNGIYRVEFLASLVHAAPGGAATDKAIIARAYRPDGSEMGAARWAGAVQALMVLDVVVAVGEYLVQGRVTDTRGRPQAGLKVVAFDRDLRKHQQLGEATTTNAVGDYAITYGLETFPSADGKAPLAPDVFVMLFLEDGMEPLGVSSTRFQARQVETIDVEIPVLAKEPSEFERVTALVMPLLVVQGTPREVFGAGVADPIPTDLQPQELNADDVEFIVRETELDAAAIQAWA